MVDPDAQRGRGIVFPSVGEYPIYDANAYDVMMADVVRVAAFKRGLEAAVRPGATVVELGCGGLAPWARLARDLGAGRVIAVESLDHAREAARLAIASDNSTGCPIELCSPADYRAYTGPVDVLVAEVVGTVGGSEGGGAYIGAEVNRIANPDLVVLPGGWASEVRGYSFQRAAAGRRPGFPPAAEPYLRKLAALEGTYTDPRLCVAGPHVASGILTAARSFEIGEFGGTTGAVHTNDVVLDVIADGLLDSLLLSVRVHVGPALIDTLAQETSWYPVVVPFASPVPVTAGDVLTVDVTSAPTDHPECPDYTFSWKLHGSSEGVAGWCELPWRGAVLGGTPLHRELLETGLP
ncbi:hypothetical protein [Rhodococcus sp. (in: high G+C Gram-positive bacteria)]|uniref:hypothetical protein n=1 Tax=Rhodococcus sp. TaxID=1831 RepID=UPI003B8A9159